MIIRFSNDIIKKFHNNISIIHGVRKCLNGNFGIDEHMMMNYGLAIPSFNEILLKLVNSNFGANIEV